MVTGLDVVIIASVVIAVVVDDSGADVVVTVVVFVRSDVAASASSVVAKCSIAEVDDSSVVAVGEALRVLGVLADGVVIISGVVDAHDDPVPVSSV